MTKYNETHRKVNIKAGVNEEKPRSEGFSTIAREVSGASYQRSKDVRGVENGFFVCDYPDRNWQAYGGLQALCDENRSRKPRLPDVLIKRGEFVVFESGSYSDQGVDYIGVSKADFNLNDKAEEWYYHRQKNDEPPNFIKWLEDNRLVVPLIYKLIDLGERYCARRFEITCEKLDGFRFSRPEI